MFRFLPKLLWSLSSTPKTGFYYVGCGSLVPLCSAACETSMHPQHSHESKMLPKVTFNFECGKKYNNNMT